MKRVLILLDGIVAKGLLDRLVQIDTSHSSYDIVYMHDDTLSDIKPQNFTFYKFDPTSFSKLKFVMNKVVHSDILVVMSNKGDTLAVVKNISLINPNIHFSVFNEWGLKFDGENISNYNAVDILSNGLIERLPNVPIVAQNIGLKQGEIMEVMIPFGSSYAYRYIGSISQKNWKIFALYRNNILITLKSTLILKPNDIILIIGKPKVLLQVYNAMSKTYGHFPVPFGKDIYVYLDLYLQSEKDVLNAIDKARFIHERLNTNKLIVKITRPTTIEIINKIKNHIKRISDKIIEFDYSNQSVETILQADSKRFDIGLFVMTNTLLSHSLISNQLRVLKVPIFKVGTENINNIKTIAMVLNDTTYYEQISPIVYDIASQLKYKINIINCDPMGDNNRQNLIEHLDNLSKIFNQEMRVYTNEKNPIKELKSHNDLLQILPMNDNMFQKRLLSFFTTNSDLLSYDLKYINQIMIPIIEDTKGEDE